MRIITAGWMITLIGILLFNLTATAQTYKNTAANQGVIFPREKALAGNFAGTIWLQSLVPNDAVYNLISGNVIFEPMGQEPTSILIPVGRYCL